MPPKPLKTQLDGAGPTWAPPVVFFGIVDTTLHCAIEQKFFCGDLYIWPNRAIIWIFRPFYDLAESGGRKWPQNP